MTIEFSHPTPILRIFDVKKAVEFYIEYLGYQVNWEHRFGDNFPLYMEIARGGCFIHLSEHHGDCTPVSALRIAVSDAEGFHAEISSREYRFQKPAFDASEKEVCLTDPFGNRLIFFQPGARNSADGC